MRRYSIMDEPKRKRKMAKRRQKLVKKPKGDVIINVNVSGGGGRGKKEKGARQPRMRRGAKSAEPLMSQPFSVLSRTPAGALVPTQFLDPKQQMLSSGEQYEQRKKEISGLLEGFETNIKQDISKGGQLLLEDIKRQTREEILRSQGIEQRGELASKFVNLVDEEPTKKSLKKMKGTSLKVRTYNPETKRYQSTEYQQRLMRKQAKQKAKEAEELNIMQQEDELNPQPSPQTIVEKMQEPIVEEPAMEEPVKTTIKVKRLKQSKLPMRDIEAQPVISEMKQAEYNLV